MDHALDKIKGKIDTDTNPVGGTLLEGVLDGIASEVKAQSGNLYDKVVGSPQVYLDGEFSATITYKDEFNKIVINAVNNGISNLEAQKQQIEEKIGTPVLEEIPSDPIDTTPFLDQTPVTIPIDQTPETIILPSLSSNSQSRSKE